MVGLLLVADVQCQVGEEVIFQDSFKDAGGEGGVLLGETSPTIGDAYSGQGTLFSQEGAATEKGDILAAFAGRSFVKPENASFDSLVWNISKWSQELTASGVVTVSFDFYMKNRGGAAKGMIGIISFSDSATGGRGWDISLKEDGSASWWDGQDFHQTEIQFDVDKVVPFKLVVDFPKRSYVATIGEESFSGTLVDGGQGVRRIMFYNSTGVEFYYADPKVAVAPER